MIETNGNVNVPALRTFSAIAAAALSVALVHLANKNQFADWSVGSGGEGVS